MFEIETIKSDIDYILGELSLMKQRCNIVGLTIAPYESIVERLLKIHSNIEILGQKQTEYKKVMRQKALKDLSKILREDN